MTEVNSIYKSAPWWATISQPGCASKSVFPLDSLFQSNSGVGRFAHECNDYPQTVVTPQQIKLWSSSWIPMSKAPIMTHLLFTPLVMFLLPFQIEGSFMVWFWNSFFMISPHIVEQSLSVWFRHWVRQMTMGYQARFPKLFASTTSHRHHAICFLSHAEFLNFRNQQVTDSFWK